MRLGKCLAFLFLLVVCGFPFANPQNVYAGVPIPEVIGPIPVTADSFPFLAANRQYKPLDLASYGYVEEEFFLSGFANV